MQLKAAISAPPAVAASSAAITMSASREREPKPIASHCLRQRSRRLRLRPTRSQTQALAGARGTAQALKASIDCEPGRHGCWQGDGRRSGSPPPDRAVQTHKACTPAALGSDIGSASWCARRRSAPAYSPRRSKRRGRMGDCSSRAAGSHAAESPLHSTHAGRTGSAGSQLPPLEDAIVLVSRDDAGQYRGCTCAPSIGRNERLTSPAPEPVIFAAQHASIARATGDLRVAYACEEQSGGSNSFCVGCQDRKRKRIRRR